MKGEIKKVENVLKQENLRFNEKYVLRVYLKSLKKDAKK